MRGGILRIRGGILNQINGIYTYSWSCLRYARNTGYTLFRLCRSSRGYSLVSQQKRARVRCRDSKVGICGEQSNTGTDFSKHSGFSLSTVTPPAHGQQVCQVPQCHSDSHNPQRRGKQYIILQPYKIRVNLHLFSFQCLVYF